MTSNRRFRAVVIYQSRRNPWPVIIAYGSSTAFMVLVFAWLLCR